MQTRELGCGTQYSIVRLLFAFASIINQRRFFVESVSWGQLEHLGDSSLPLGYTQLNRPGDGHD